MADSEIQYLHQQLTTGQIKYTYFLLAASASAIALALNRTVGQQLSYAQIPLGAAVLCWGLSFFYGCRYIGWTNATLRANATFLTIERGQHPEVGTHPQLIQAAASGVKEAADFNAEQAGRYGRRQFRFLVAGALCYIVWHVVQMALNTPAGPRARMGL